MKNLIKTLSVAAIVGLLALSSCSKDDAQFTPQPENPLPEQPVNPVLPDNAIEF